jgi:hypothetical protein
MRTLATRIRRELRKSVLPIPYSAIYEEELQRFLPSELQDREAEIEKFAKQHGFKLRFYKRGLCAIFQESREAHRRGNDTVCAEIRNLKRDKVRVGKIQGEQMNWNGDDGKPFLSVGTFIIAALAFIAGFIAALMM